MKTWLLICFLFVLSIGFAQTHVTMSLQNCASNSDSTLDYELYIVNDDTIRLAAVSFGINYNSGILNGGTPSTTAYKFQLGSEDPALTNLNPYTTYHTLNRHHLRLTMSPLAISSAIVIAPNVQ